MREAPALSPLGTARQRLAAAAAYPAGLLDSLRDADLGEEEAFLAWQMGQLAGVGSETERRDVVRLIARSLVSVSQGSTRMPLTEAEGAWLRTLTTLVGAPGQDKPLIVDGSFLYHQRILACETRVAGAIKMRTAQPGADPQLVASVVAEVAGSSRPRLGDEQRAAVLAALGRRVAVVSGRGSPTSSRAMSSSRRASAGRRTPAASTRRFTRKTT